MVDIKSVVPMVHNRPIFHRGDIAQKRIELIGTSKRVSATTHQNGGFSKHVFNEDGSKKAEIRRDYDIFDFDGEKSIKTTISKTFTRGKESIERKLLTIFESSSGDRMNILNKNGYQTTTFQRKTAGKWLTYAKSTCPEKIR